MSDSKVEAEFVDSRTSRGSHSSVIRCGEPDVNKRTSENGFDIVGA